MKKTIRVFSVLALILAGLCMLALLVCICAQKALLPIYGAPEEVLGRFYFPAGAAVFAAGVLVAAILLMAGNNKHGILMEIIVAILVFVTPTMQSLMSTMQPMMAGRYGGSAFLAGMSAMNALSSLPLGCGRLALTLLTLVCGMSIAYKKMK